MTPWLLNGAWQLACKPAATCFRRAIENPRRAQEKVLRDMLAQNRATGFGRRHRFATIVDARDFQARVPLQTYDSLAPMIASVARGDGAVLTREPPTRLLPSSGSSAARKLIPYTPAYQRQLARAISPWIYDLMVQRPAIKSGRAFWSVSPRVETMAGDHQAVPIGFDHDSAYLGKWSRPIARRLLALPPGLEQVTDIDEFRYRQLLHLLACGDLSLVSIWHPSYLTLLLDGLPDQWDRLMRDLGKTCADRERIDYLRRTGCESCEALWPGLRMISCWGSAHAAGALRELEALFPRTEFQEKGLLATEAAVSIPLFDDAGVRVHKILAINSHFLEFLTDDGSSRLADELVEGETYRVVVTTAAGLYRYQLQDRVQVSGMFRRTPTIEFIGKEDSISDYRGEKLSDSFVGDRLRRLLEQQRIEPAFAMLAPDEKVDCIGYTLYLEARAEVPACLGARLDGLLAENPHYRLCRDLGQLAPIRVFNISADSNRSYIRRRLQQGCSLGDIKPVSLSPQRGWSDCFEGAYLAPADTSNLVTA